MKFNKPVLPVLEGPAFVFLAMLILLALGLYSQLGYESHRRYPSVKSIVSDYPRYVGQRVAFWGNVVEVNDGSLKILTKYDSSEVAFTLLSDAVAAIGDDVEAAGILEPDYRLSVERLNTYKKWKGELILVRSAFAVPLLWFVFFGSWRFDRKSKRFVERT